MVSTNIIIVLCLILIIAYVFDLSSRFTKIPGIVLLIVVGISLKYFTNFANIEVPSLAGLTPLLGTIGLILIVLEGSLDLKVSTKKIKVIKKTFYSSLILLIVNSLITAVLIIVYFKVSFMNALVNAIPLGIISSALAIPASQNLSEGKKEFITYESSFSDILGVLFFNFFAFNELHGLAEIWIYSGQLLMIILISVVCCLALGFLLQNIHHHIKFVPIIATLILVYALAKLIHMPSLVVVMAFGLFLNNINRLHVIPYLGNKINYDLMEYETNNFKHLVGELAFTIRSFFFILLGFSTDINSILNVSGLLEALVIVAIILLTRLILFKFILKISLLPELFFAPRGLITILLFLSIPTHYFIPQIETGLLLQVVLVTSLVMSAGLILTKDKKV
jgi:Kef-type K+ transport system membrane component KefB